MSLMYLIICSAWLCLWINTALHTEKIHLVVGSVAVLGNDVTPVQTMRLHKNMAMILRIL